MNKEQISNSYLNNSSPTILIVDDEPDIIELLELTLARMGMQVFSAKSIQHLLLIYREFYQLIFL